MLCSKCKINEIDSASGMCWWCINNAKIRIKEIHYEDENDFVKDLENPSDARLKVALKKLLEK